jgi:hypothetical protein
VRRILMMLTVALVYMLLEVAWGRQSNKGRGVRPKDCQRRKQRV